MSIQRGRRSTSSKGRRSDEVITRLGFERPVVWQQMGPRVRGASKAESAKARRKESVRMFIQ